MQQVIRKGLRDIILDEVPDPVVQPHHVIVSPHFSLISSGTETADIHTDPIVKEVAENPGHIQKVWNVMTKMGPAKTIAEVRAKFSDYAVLGYSGAGVIIAKHESVSGLAVGDRVAYGGEGTGHGEAILVGKNLAARVPDSLGFDQAAFATLGAIAMNAVRVARIGLGEHVVVLGLGLVGQLTAQLARAQGGRVIALDLKPDRVELARGLGADEAVLGGDGAQESILALTEGRGADCVIVAAAAKHSAAPCQQALRLCRDRGRIVIVGAVDMHFPWAEMYIKEIELLMARAYGPGSYDADYEKRGRDYPLPYVRWTENRNMEEFLRLVDSRQVNVEKLITHRFALDRASEAYATILDPSTNSLAVVLEYPQSRAGAAPYQLKHKVPIAPVYQTKPAGKNDLKAGLIGAGNLAKWEHLPNLQKAAGVTLQSVYSSNGARGKSYGNRFGAAFAYSDCEEMLRDPALDFVVIVSRNADHAPQALAALAAGKHVLLEKPMALTVAECQQLEAAVASSGKLLSVGFNRRFAPYYVRVKEALRRRTGPAVVNFRMNSPGISGNYWMADMSIGGAILGEASHFTDLFYWLLESEPTTVYARALDPGKSGTIGENNMACSFSFADGSIANLTYTTVGSATSGGERLEVFADGIGAVTEDFTKVAIKGSSVSKQSRTFAEKGYAAQLDDFLTAIRAGKAPSVTVRDGSRSTILCLQMLESARTGLPIRVDLEQTLATGELAPSL